MTPDQKRQAYQREIDAALARFRRIRWRLRFIRAELERARGSR